MVHVYIPFVYSLQRNHLLGLFVAPAPVVWFCQARMQQAGRFPHFPGLWQQDCAVFLHTAAWALQLSTALACLMRVRPRQTFTCEAAAGHDVVWQRQYLVVQLRACFLCVGCFLGSPIQCQDPRVIIARGFRLLGAGPPVEFEVFFNAAL